MARQPETGWSKESRTLNQPIVFIHIMKTAGTSFRKVVEQALGDLMYPRSEQLNTNPRAWYLACEPLLELVNQGALKNTKMVFGHYPLAIAPLIFPTPFTATFVREPVARSVSRMKHHLRVHQKPGQHCLSDLLDNKRFVARQIENYQTKVFSQEDPTVMPFLPFEHSDESISTALNAVGEMDFVGITERFEESVQLFSKLTGIELSNTTPQENAAHDSSDITAEERDRIEELVEKDQLLYQAATTRHQRLVSQYLNAASDKENTRGT